MRYISIANIVKLGLFTVLVCTNFELWAQAQQHSQHKLEDQKAPVCESLKTQAKSKKAYEQCNKYCEDLKCTDPSRKDKLDCLSALAKFQALGLGNPPCIGPKRAYISNYNANTVSTCNVKEDGVFEKCIDSGVGAIFDSPVGIAINSIQNTAYITNYGNNKANYSVSKCAINGAGLFSACVDSGVGVAFTKPFDIALTQDENSAFVTNNEEAIRVSKCDIEKGDFTGCVDTSASMSGRPVGLAFNHANNIVYVANDSGHGVYKCALKDTRFSDCTSTGSGFTNTIGVAISNSGKFVYVTNDSKDTVSKCTIDAAGKLTDCVDSGVGAIFNFPLGITLTKSGDAAYIANLNSNRVTRCAININSKSTTYGQFTGCQDSGGTFVGPFNVMFTY